MNNKNCFQPISEKPKMTLEISKKNIEQFKSLKSREVLSKSIDAITDLIVNENYDAKQLEEFNKKLYLFRLEKKSRRIRKKGKI